MVNRVKNGKSWMYDLSKSDTKLLRRWLKERNKLDKASEFLFIPARRGRDRLHRNTVQKLFKKYLKLSGNKRDLGVHCLRHSAGADMAIRGERLLDIKRRMGHSKIDSTMVYLELGIPEEREKQKKISNGFSV